MDVKANTGLLPRPLPASALKEFFPIIDDSRTSLYLPSRRGEDIPAVHERGAITLDALIQTASSPRLLLVTHAATAVTLVRALVGDPKLPLRVGCCSISTLTRSTLGNWQPVGQLANADHLTNGIERDWGFEDVSFANGHVVEDEGEGEGPETDEGPTGLSIELPNNSKYIRARL